MKAIFFIAIILIAISVFIEFMYWRATWRLIKTIFDTIAEILKWRKPKC